LYSYIHLLVSLELGVLCQFTHEGTKQEN